MIRLLCLAAVAGLLVGEQPSERRASQIQWQQMSGPYGGEARSLLVHRNQLLVRGDSEVWRSADRGRTWRPMTRRFAEGWGFVQSGSDLFMQDIDGLHRTATLGASWVRCGAVPLNARSDRHLVPVGSWLLYWLPEIGLFRSNDRCASWTPVTVPWTLDPGPLSFVVSRASGPVFAMTLRGSFRSVDSGATWEPATAPPAQVFTSVPDSGAGVLIGTSDGVYRTTDDGLSWAHLGFGRRWVRSLVVSASGEIYAAVEGLSPSRTTVMRSIDNGRTWTDADEGLSGYLVTGLARDDSGAVYAASDTGVYRLARSARWQHVGLPTFFTTSLFVAPWSTVYATAPVGAYRTTGNGADWRALWLPDEYPGPMIATMDGDLLLQLRDRLYRSSDRGETWRKVGLQQHVTALFAVPASRVILAGTGDGLFRSVDNGETWVERSTGLQSFTMTSFAPSTDGVLFAGTVVDEGDGEVYRSTDMGERWQLLAPEFPGGSVNALAVLAAGDVFAGTSRGLYRWTPGSTNWQEVEIRPRRTRVSTLLVDRSGRLIAGTTSAGVFVSEDQGQTWSSANLGLRNLRVRTLAADPDGDLYVAVGRESGLGGEDDLPDTIGIFRGRFVGK